MTSQVQTRSARRFQRTGRPGSVPKRFQTKELKNGKRRMSKKATSKVDRTNSREQKLPEQHLQEELPQQEQHERAQACSHPEEPKVKKERKQTACQSRQPRMRQWLEESLDANRFPGLEWQDKANKTFTVSWLHKSRHTFNPDAHTDVFQAWATYKGQPHTDHTILKANFRCALKSLKDVEEITLDGSKKGPEAKRTYRFLLRSDPKYGKNRKSSSSSKKTKSPGKSRASSGRRRRRELSSSSSNSNSVASPGILPSYTIDEDDKVTRSGASTPDMLLQSCDDERTSLATDLGFVPVGERIIAEASQTQSQRKTKCDIIDPRDAGFSGAQPLAVMPGDPSQDLQVLPSTIYNSHATTATSSSINSSTSIVEPDNYIQPWGNLLLKTERGESSVDNTESFSAELQVHSGTESRLPHFDKLGVPDTYSLEEISPNSRLACGGQVKVRLTDTDVENSCEIPVQEIITRYWENEDTSMVAPSQEMLLLQSQSLLYPIQAGDYNLPQLDGSELDIGQTLEVGFSTTDEEPIPVPAASVGTALSTAAAVLNSDASFYIEGDEQRIPNSGSDALVPHMINTSEILPAVITEHIQPLENPAYPEESQVLDLEEIMDDLFQIGEM